MNKKITNPSASITCRESVYLVSQWRDGELDDQDKQRLSLHVSICERCQVANKQFQMLFAGLDDLLARPGNKP